MGGLTYGLSTVEMAAAFSSFANSGVYNSPKMYTEVRDSNGEVVLKNEGETHAAMKETTAYFMNQMLTSVVNAGTGTSAKFGGMTIAGKTGTHQRQPCPLLCGLHSLLLCRSVDRLSLHQREDILLRQPGHQHVEAHYAEDP